MSRTTSRAGLLLAVCLASPAIAGEPDFEQLFAGRDGCFELYDLTAGELVVRYGSDRCALRTSPCSTFKVPLALMAFDAGILVAENSSMKWDGTKYSRETWNRDHTAATWMRDSVVWFSQRLTPQLGMERVESYLASFKYGNEDMSGGITQAWLDSSLTISPDEQLVFLQRFWLGQLAVSPYALEVTKRITLVDRSSKGWTLHGKTGSGGGGSNGDNAQSPLWLGWFVGHVAKENREYVFVTTYTDRVLSHDKRPPGWIARDIAKKILTKLGVY